MKANKELLAADRSVVPHVSSRNDDDMEVGCACI